MTRRVQRGWLGLALVGLSCAGSGPGAAVVNTAVAVGYAAHERSHGRGCWGSCQAGTACNEATGMCEPIPCGGCRAGYTCQQTPVGERCVAPNAELDLAPLPVLVSPAPLDAGLGDAGLGDAGLGDGGLGDAR